VTDWLTVEQRWETGGEPARNDRPPLLIGLRQTIARAATAPGAGMSICSPRRDIEKLAARVALRA
jgi:hypothetical protein